MYYSEMSLYTNTGQRKYLNKSERRRFLACTQNLKRDRRAFCQILWYTGARIGEVYNLRTGQIDFSNKSIVFETLKKRKRGVFRALPVPTSVLEDLQHCINQNGHKDAEQSKKIWTFSLRSADRYVKRTMHNAGVTGKMGSAKGLRHGFAVDASTKIPITKVRKWLGHSDIKTTAIYLDSCGEEERELARRLWNIDE